MEQHQVFIQQGPQYEPLNENDTINYEQNKKNINLKIRETFPSIPADFELKPVSVLRIQGCGTFYNFKVALPDNQFANVSFNTGGMYMIAPGVKDYRPPSPTIAVEQMAT